MNDETILMTALESLDHQISTLSQVTDDINGSIASLQELKNNIAVIEQRMTSFISENLEEVSEENVKVVNSKISELLSKVQNALNSLEQQKAATSDEVPESDRLSEEVFESGHQDGAEDNVSEDHDNPDYLESSKTTIQQNIVEIKALKEEIQQKNALIRELEESYDDNAKSFKEEIATLTGQLDDLKKKLNESHRKLSARQGTEQDIQNLQLENEKLKQEKQEKIDAFNGLTRDNEYLKESINSWSAQYDELFSKLNTAEQEGARVRQAFESREEEQEQKQTQLNEMQEALRDKEALIAQLQQKYNLSIQKSVSWKRKLDNQNKIFAMTWLVAVFLAI